MGRVKRRRYAALREMPNVVDGRRYDAGWFEGAFGRVQTVALELGCGRAEYTLALARSRPDRGVVGVDRNGARLWKGAIQALDEGLANAWFLRAPVEDLTAHIPPRRVAEIWLPFPDPLRKRRQARHRLPSVGFLERYRRLLAPGGVIHVKTDDLALLEFAECAVRGAGGRAASGGDPDGDTGMVPAVVTSYERRYRREGRPIYQRTFCLE